ncbi:hypothetical protein ALC57_18301 [Trachymyrmex cornetzi]|uniref:Uncharacterized protein n=1 Tax=Trachymyrmex cornetzi TaxID=471704 RepID=A0A151ISJ5_9HYME|nr:hypothetical protein ALC57_18301 [Trachymyrmex cornetzi]
MSWSKKEIPQPSTKEAKPRGEKEGEEMGRGSAGRAEKSARNAAQLSCSYSKLAYRLTSFRLGYVVDVLRCRDRAGSFPVHRFPCTPY